VTVKPKPLSRPWWNYVRFSLRALIVLVLLIGAGLGWLVRSAHVQRDAVAAIRRAGGSVSYDWEWNNGKSVPGGKPWAPKWLVDLIGVDYFAHVTSVWGSPNSRVTRGHLGQGAVHESMATSPQKASSLEATSQARRSIRRMARRLFTSHFGHETCDIRLSR
jgi:hypothetical protein